MSIIPANTNLRDVRSHRIAREADLQAFLAEVEANLKGQGLGGLGVGLRVTCKDTGRRYIAGDKVSGLYRLIHDDTGEIDAAAFGVVDDVQQDDTGSMTAGSAVITLSTARFTAADVGKNIIVTGKVGMVDTVKDSAVVTLTQNVAFTADDVGKNISMYIGSGYVGTRKINAVASDGRTATLDAVMNATWGPAQPSTDSFIQSARAYWGGPGGGGVPLGATTLSALPVVKILSVSSDGKSATLDKTASLTASGLHVEWGTDCSDSLAAWVAALGAARPGLLGRTPGGTGIIWTRYGLGLLDDTRIRVANKVTLRVPPCSPERTVEKTQTSLLTGANAYSMSSSAGTYRLRIGGEQLTLDTNFQYAPLAMLGGGRFFGIQNSTIENIRVIGASTPNAGQAGFGVQVSTTSTGPDVTGNLFDLIETEHTAEWFTAGGSNVNQNSLIGFILSSVSTGYAGRNGAHRTKARDVSATDWELKYTPSRTYKNTVKRLKCTGGSHGLSLTNVRDNKFQDIRTKNCAHRGVIITPTCDDNIFEDGYLEDSGATAFHIAYDSRRNKIYRFTANGVRSITEGDGFKAYVLCDNNEFHDCIAINVGRNSFRWAHGSNNNKRYRCKAYWTKEKTVAAEGQPETDWQLTKGFVMWGAAAPQWTAQDYALNQPDMRLCLNNEDIDCEASGLYLGFVQDADISTLSAAVSGNNWRNCKAFGCGVGFPDPKKAAAGVVAGNYASDVTGIANDKTRGDKLSDRFLRTIGVLDLPDKGLSVSVNSVSGSRQPEWDNYLAWTDNPALTTTTYKPSSGNLMLAYTKAVKAVAAGGTLSAVYNVTAVASADLTLSRIVVYRASDGAQVALSAEAVGDWQSTGNKKTALTVSQAINAGDALYIGVLAIGTTPPTLSASAGSGVINLGAASAGAAVKRAVLSNQTAVPSSVGVLGTASGTTQTPWFALA